MIGVAVLLIGLLVLWRVTKNTETSLHKDIATPKTNERLKRLWQYVNTNFKSGKYRTTEKALLAILKIDHKNTAAYNRLGMLYAKQQNYDDAIECFEIASSLTPTLATLYNLGLVHYEKGNYRQASTAFEKVVDLDPDVKRYMAYAKSLEKMGDYKKVAEILESVVKLEPSPRHMELQAEALARAKEYEKAEDLRKKAAAKRSRQLVNRRENATSTTRSPAGRRVS